MLRVGKWNHRPFFLQAKTTLLYHKNHDLFLLYTLHGLMNRKIVRLDYNVAALL